MAERRRARRRDDGRRERAYGGRDAELGPAGEWFERREAGAPGRGEARPYGRGGRGRGADRGQPIGYSEGGHYGYEAERADRGDCVRREDHARLSGYGRPSGEGWGGEAAYPGREAFREPGPYAGRGPKGYRRPDERILEDVCDRLTAHGYLDASDVECKVENGEVTLTGTVATRREKRLAEDVIGSVPGVKDIFNLLRLRRGRTLTS